MLTAWDRQQCADLVHRFGERRTLGGHDTLLDHRRDVLEAEHVLRVGQLLERAAEQLAVGAEHALHVDLAAFDRLVGEFDRDRLELAFDPVQLLDARQTLFAGREFGRAADRELVVQRLQVTDAREFVFGCVVRPRDQHVRVEEGRFVEQREPFFFDERLRLFIGLLFAGRGLRLFRDGREQHPRVLRVAVDLPRPECLVDQLGGADFGFELARVALRPQRLRIELADDVRLGEVLAAECHGRLAGAGTAR